MSNERLAVAVAIVQRPDGLWHGYVSAVLRGSGHSDRPSTLSACRSAATQRALVVRWVRVILDALGAMDPVAALAAVEALDAVEACQPEVSLDDVADAIADDHPTDTGGDGW